MLTILVVVLLLMALGALPTWPHSRNWGYYPSGGLGLVVLILVILLPLRRDIALQSPDCAPFGSSSHGQP